MGYNKKQPTQVVKAMHLEFRDNADDNDLLAYIKQMQTQYKLTMRATIKRIILEHKSV